MSHNSVKFHEDSRGGEKVAACAVLSPLWPERLSKSLCSLEDTSDGKAQRRVGGGRGQNRVRGRNVAWLLSFTFLPRGTLLESQYQEACSVAVGGQRCRHTKMLCVSSKAGGQQRKAGSFMEDQCGFKL